MLLIKNVGLRLPLLVTALSLATLNSVVLAEAPVPLPPVTQPAPPVAPAASIRFSQQPTQVGDRVGQDLSVGLNIKATYTQAGQTAHESDATMRRQQQRLIEVLEVAQGRLRRARVTFPVSRTQAPDQEQRPHGELQPQPIEGKTYVATRDGEQLTITDEEGLIPPLEEFQAAFESLATLGMPNSLAQFLLERPVKLGERMLLPREIASALLGTRDELGAIKRFELQLLNIEPAPVAGASPRAVFKAKIETMPNDASPIALSIDGRVTIETETCRTVAAELSGPVKMASTEQTAGGVVHFTADGALRMAIRSHYGRPKSRR